MLRHRFFVVAVALSAIFGLWSAPTARAAVLTVPGDHATIQECIDAAVSGVDECLVAPGTYNETINFTGKAITLRSSDGPAATIIDATGASGCIVDDCSVVKCISGEGAGTILDGFTVTGGTGTVWVHPGGNTYLVGGGMYNENSSPTLTHCTFTGNSIDGPAYSDSFGGGLFNANSGPVLTDCAFIGNTAGHTDNYGSGGGMYNESSSPMLTNCTFSGNTAGHSYRTGNGGGMYNENSSPTLFNCTFSGNTAAGAGGFGNINGSSPTLTNCTFTDNKALFYTGGGMRNYNGSNPTLDNCTFTANWAFYGGGMFNKNSSSPTLTDCVFTDNLGHYTGGGMDNEDNSSPVLTNCTFIGNHASAYQGYRGWGGGMSNYDDSNPMLINCMFIGNSALRLGAGIYNHVSSPTVTNSMFSGNAANVDGGGMFNFSHSIGTSSPTVTNCTFSGNTATNGNAVACDSVDQLYPSTVVLANCILWNGGGEIWNNDGSAITISYSNIEGWTSGGVGNIASNPLFVRPPDPGPDGNWDGIDDDYGDLRLLSGSPCIDDGSNAAVPIDITTDLDGNPRFVDDPNTPDCPQPGADCGTPPIVDMGAYEHWLNCEGDIDCDGIADETDNCPTIPNEDQADLDGDGLGDVCDGDVDGDGEPNETDNCPRIDNASQEDADEDGVGDACDVAPLSMTTPMPTATAYRMAATTVRAIGMPTRPTRTATGSGMFATPT